MPRARSIFLGGTASHVGKSWMTTAVCAWLRERGLRVAPFKAQNMSNNSYPCPGGGEIGRAQVAQAEACGLEPSPDFNPILLKPDADACSQVVVNGKVWKTLKARDYYENFDYLLGQVLDAYERLAARFEVIVIEGAGSVTEMNLRRTDLVNFGLATRIGSPAMLVADIDRGGVFASIVGTHVLLPPEESALLRSFAVNRFRGDRSLFSNGVTMLEERTGLKCMGVFPYTRDIHVDEEDGVSLEDRARSGSKVGIIALPRISNLTDFRLLPTAVVIDRPLDRLFDTLILPGTKATEADLQWLRDQGLDRWILRQHAAGATILGICGGYQMLGRRAGDMQGLGLLPVETDFEDSKITVTVEAEWPDGHRFPAYEIHMGRTTRPDRAEPFATINGRPEGVRLGRVLGTYLHGALEDPHVASAILGHVVDAPASKRGEYAKLAQWFAENADTRAFEELYL
ncbi:MAG: cobyric acid synthase [Acidobacteria bacterium]|nr:cobyric acid synthase [Acidobacteriota bacterium]